MTDLLSYMKSSAPLEEREEILFSIIDKLDKESLALFGDIIDLNGHYLYKYENLMTRTSELKVLLEEVVKSFEYISEIEQSSYNYANKRFQFKKMLTAIVTVYAFLSNALLGIASFVLLSNKANKDFVGELTDINDTISKFDAEKLMVIDSTLQNCVRILKGKIEKLPDFMNMCENGTDQDKLFIFSNYIISSYINEVLNDEDINSINEDLRCSIINILKNDLNIDSDNIIELLHLAKNKNDNSIKLLKEY